MPSPRRRPHCTRCNLPMAGHRRPNGTPICPSMPTPPATPGPQGYVREATDEDAHTAIDDADAEDVKPVRAYYKSVRTLADVPYPPDGRYHYRNPNWGTSTVLDLAPALDATASGACAQNGHLYDEDGEEESTGPTVLNGHAPKRHLPGRKMDQHSPHRSRLVSDPKRQQLLYAYQQQQQQLQALEFPPTTAPCSAIDPDATPALEDESISVRMMRTMTASAAVLRALIGNGTPPGAGLYTTTRSALSAAQRAARRQGYHTGVMEKPRTHPAPARRLAAESTVWMVVGTEKEAVDHLLDLQLDHTTSGKDARAAPGAIGLLQEPYNLGTPRGLIFSQLVMAGVVGGLFVVVALAYWF